MSLKIYNSLTREKESFKPINEGSVGMYVCGPTVYGDAHLGHAKSYVSFDIIARYIEYLGYDLTYVQNITDVGHLTDDADEGEDKLAVAAKKQKKHPMALAEYYTASYFEDMDKLNCRRPDISPRATGHIPEQIELIEKLIDAGHAYEVNGSVYFDVTSFKGYGKLSGRNLEDMLSGTRVDVKSEKKHPADFALWKKAEPNHIMQWKSPWGMGYPGWHLECSVMSMKYLGDTIDIHGGGLENKFPHHECEIAQSEAVTECPFVKYWLHNNMVTVDGTKMGKSLNNFINLKQVFAGSHERLSKAYDPLAVRMLILNSHYRSPLDFSDAALSAAESGLDKISSAVKAVRRAAEKAPEGEMNPKVQKQLEGLRHRFEKAMNDDFNTSVALSVLYELVKLAEKEAGKANRASLNAVDELFSSLGGDVLGVVRESYPEDSKALTDLADYLMQDVIEKRAKARAEKNFQEADRIRDEMAKFGVTFKDTPNGTEWVMQ
ncbi:Cysteine--tRNA ligase [Sedimentisphaera cyanobacteriorum]|uniref:Cysteine--tRNA ligase n=1 Tax=Sedimentisphaera cyanobacteriorum TaxID=1940790 RepID=A0A1Q2HRG6_9BACT|nr:cysteine--tRNA ligase [Sedimentisphaera cyanobacteriorum]AQQ09825.1 Cysteine--tRNA ligase [Sedimentisphaera cyanobacteriorum]